MQDKLLVLSENQELSANAESDYYVDTTAISNPGTPFICEVVVTKAFSGGSITAEVQVGDDEDFSNTKSLVQGVLKDEELELGGRKIIPIPYNFDKTMKHLRVYYTLSGASGGAVTTVLQPRVFTNEYPTFARESAE